jgi:hypothetical protein
MALPIFTSASRVVTAADVDGSQIPKWAVTGAAWMSMGATCSIANGVLTGRLLFTDSFGNVTGTMGPVTFNTASGPADFGALWLGTPDQAMAPNVCADFAGFKVDAVTGSWTLNAQVFER